MRLVCIQDTLRGGSATDACAALAMVPHVGGDPLLLELSGRVLVTGAAGCAAHMPYPPFARSMAGLVLALLAHGAGDQGLSGDLLGALLAACQALVAAPGPGPLACLTLLGDCMALSSVFIAFAVAGAASVVGLICGSVRQADDDDDDGAEAALYLLLQMLADASGSPAAIEAFLNAFAEADGLPVVIGLLSAARDASDGATTNGLAVLKVLCGMHAAAPLAQRFAGDISVAVLPKLVCNHRTEFIVAAADILAVIVTLVSATPAAVNMTLKSLRTAMTRRPRPRLLVALAG